MITAETRAERRRSDRRYAHGELLLASFIAARTPLTFDDLVGVLNDTGARISDVATWLARAVDSGLIDPQPFAAGDHGEPVGPRLYMLSDAARFELRARRGERRRPA